MNEQGQGAHAPMPNETNVAESSADLSSPPSTSTTLPIASLESKDECTTQSSINGIGLTTSTLGDADVITNAEIDNGINIHMYSRLYTSVDSVHVYIFHIRICTRIESHDHYPSTLI
jgi:hypothetical protein